MFSYLKSPLFQTLLPLYFYNKGFLARFSACLRLKRAYVITSPALFELFEELVESWSHKYFEDTFPCRCEIGIYNSQNLFNLRNTSKCIHIGITRRIWRHITQNNIKMIYSMICEYLLHSYCISCILDIRSYSWQYCSCRFEVQANNVLLI